MGKGLIALVILIAAVGGGFWYIESRGSNDAYINAEAQKEAAAMAPYLSGTAPAQGAPSNANVQSEGSLHMIDSEPAGAAPATAAPTPPITNQPPQKIMHATLHTNKGDISIEFLDAQAPNTVANFIKLAQSGFYDGTKFHRVIKNFMIQGGDPLTKDDTKQSQWGMGGPGYQFADELGASNHNVVGTIAMANSGPNTNGSQFFINVANNNFLDDKHTVFGRVTAGMEVVHAIEDVQTGASDRPVAPVIIESVTVS